jgi:hypothetical protein
MFLLDWYKEWLNIRSEFKEKNFELTREVKQESTICQSCETLKKQLEISNYEKDRLLNRLLEKPEVIPDRTIAPELTAVRPKMIPWHLRKQMLEREDREKARALRDAAKPDSSNNPQSNEINKMKVDVTELEKELKIAAEERESKSIIG